MKRANLSPAQTTLLAALGSILAASGFLVLAPHEPTPSLRYTHVTISIVLCILGFYLSLKSQAALKDGVQSNFWPQEQIEPLRKIFDSIHARFFSTALVFALVGFLIFTLFHGSRFILLWPLIILSQTLTQLQQALKPPPPPRSSIDWHRPLPLQSEHWGQH